MAEHPRSARHVGVLHSAGILRARTSPSHGENRGSSPLGSANDFRHLAGATHSNEGRCLFFV